MAQPPVSAAHTQSGYDVLQPQLAITIAFLILNTLFIGLRFFTAVYLRRSKARLGWDDFWLVPAYLANLALIILSFKMRSTWIRTGLSAHEYLNPLTMPQLIPEALELLQCIYAFSIVLMPVFACTRLSILALYLRIFTGRRVRLACYIVSGLCITQWIASQIVAINMCRPIHKFWDRLTVLDGYCVDANAYYRAVSWPTLVFDAFLIVLPLPTVWQLHASRGRKIALSLLFLTSVLAFISSAYRTVIYQTHDGTALAPYDTNIFIAPIIGETGIYLIVGCLPAMAPLVQAVLPSSYRRAGDRVGLRMPKDSFPASSVENGGHHRSDFTRLVDSDATAMAIAESGDHKGRTTPTAMEMHDRSGTPNGGMRDSDMRGLQGGHGVLVHTEIIVTTEEKISEVIGL